MDWLANTFHMGKNIIIGFHVRLPPLTQGRASISNEHYFLNISFWVIFSAFYYFLLSFSPRQSITRKYQNIRKIFLPTARGRCTDIRRLNEMPLHIFHFMYEHCFCTFHDILVYYWIFRRYNFSRTISFSYTEESQPRKCYQIKSRQPSPTQWPPHELEIMRQRNK